MFQVFRSRKDRSLAYLHAEASTASVENAAIAYQSPALLFAGAKAGEIALLSTITNFLYATFLLRVPSVIKQGDSLKRVVVVLSLIGAIGWLPLILVPILVKDIAIWLLIVLWVINLVPSLIAGPLTDKWLSDLVPPNKLARYLGIRSIFSAATYISSFYVMGYLLDHFQGNVFNGFSLVFLLAFLGSIGSFILCLLLKVAVPFGEDSQVKFGIFSFIKEAKQNNLGVLITFTASIILTASIVGHLFSVYMLEDLHFTYLIYTLVISVEYLARIAVSYFGGRWVDHAGAIKVLRYTTPLIPFIPVLWLFSANIAYLMCLQILSGIAWATYDLCVQSYLCRASPQNKRLHYIVYQRSIVTVAAAVGPLAGAFLLDKIYPIFGNPIFSIFLLSGFLRLVVVLAMLPMLKKAVTNPQDSDWEHDESTGNIVLKPTVNYQSYPLYRLAVQPAKSRPGNIVSNTRQNHTNHFSYGESTSFKPETPVMKPTTENIRQDMLYRKDSRPQYPHNSPLVKENPEKVRRLNDNLSRDIEYHKKWASKVTSV